MAGDWIPMRLDLAEDPAVLEMVELTGLDEFGVVGRLHAIWSWVSRQCNGDVTLGALPHALARVTRVELQFIDALQQVGWLEVLEVDGRPAIRIPNYDRWLSQGAKTRQLTSRRVARHRAESCNASSVTKSLPEKSREEYKKPPNIPLAKKRKTYGEEFGKWFLAFPKKRSKAEAAKKYPKAVQQLMKDRGVSEAEAHEILIQAVQRYADQMAGQDSQFIKHPSTWLNQGCWDDELDAAPSKVATPDDLANWRP